MNAPYDFQVSVQFSRDPRFDGLHDEAPDVDAASAWLTRYERDAIAGECIAALARLAIHGGTRTVRTGDWHFVHMTRVVAP